MKKIYLKDWEKIFIILILFEICVNIINVKTKIKKVFNVGSLR